MRPEIHTTIDSFACHKLDKVGGTNKANRVIRTLDKRERIESAFMGIAFKSNRAEAQRTDRQAKRK